MTSDQQARKIEELQAKLDIANKPSTSQLDHNGWKATVNARMSEEKLVKLNTELEQKVVYHFIIDINI